MERARIDELLATYRVNVARINHIEVRLKELDPIIAELNKHAAWYATNTTGSYSGMPGGGPVESKVEKLAITLAEGKLPGEMGALVREAEALREEMEARQTRVRYVDAWLCGLTEREKMVLTTHIIDGLTWREVGAVYQDKYGLEYSRTGLKALCDRARDKVYAIAG